MAKIVASAQISGISSARRRRSERLKTQEVQIFLRSEEVIGKLLKKLEDFSSPADEFVDYDEEKLIHDSSVEMWHDELKVVANKASELEDKIETEALEGHQSASNITKMFTKLNSNPLDKYDKDELKKFLSSLEHFLFQKDALDPEPAGKRNYPVVEIKASERCRPPPVAHESGCYGREDIKETEGCSLLTSSTMIVSHASTEQLLETPPCRWIWLAWSVKRGVEKLKGRISAIKAFLPDAEERQFDDPKVSEWLERHQKFMIDADKVLDKLESQQLRREVQKMYGGKRRKVYWLFLPSNPIAFRLSIGRKIRKLSRSLDKITKEKDVLQLVKRREETGMRKQRRTCADVVGRDSDKEKIIELVLGENEDTPKVHVVSIVGVGGMGKTTLARLVYNDETVKNHFELKMWVCNSDDDFHVGRLLKEILDSATGKKNDGFTYDQLHTHLRGLLKNKRFLLILDEMQNEDRMKWSELNKFLVGGSKGSRILVTTRSQKVAEIMRSNKSIHTLQDLSKEDCETLFLRYSFDEGKLEERKWDIGKQMVERCKGVPLAAKILASLLYSKREDSEWERIRDHHLWSRKQNEEDFLSPVLLLSYNDLPAHLRPCFVCSSLFPKGCRFSFNEVLDVWMARGLFGSADQDESIEEVCKEYLDQLIFRSLIEQEEEYTYYMHDLIHDFALQLPQNKCSVITSPTQAVDGHTAISYEPVVLHEASEESVRNVLSKRNVSKFKYLRMLDLGGSSIEMLPGCIGKLRHLRSLNLCANQSLKRLPNSIWKLQSLGILRLDGCKELVELPKDIRKMIRLKILTITTRATYLPDKGIECLMYLQSLEIRDCKHLRALPSVMFGRLTELKRLEIHDCPRLDISKQNEENHNNQSSLRYLTLNGLRKMMTLPQFLEGCRGTLRHLKISRCPIKELPEWIESVESISIQFCPNLNSLPEGMTRLTSLPKLEIQECPGLL